MGRRWQYGGAWHTGSVRLHAHKHTPVHPHTHARARARKCIRIYYFSTATMIRERASLLTSYVPLPNLLFLLKQNVGSTWYTLWLVFFFICHCSCPDAKTGTRSETQSWRYRRRWWCIFWVQGACQPLGLQNCLETQCKYLLPFNSLWTLEVHCFGNGVKLNICMIIMDSVIIFSPAW